MTDRERGERGEPALRFTKIGEQSDAHLLRDILMTVPPAPVVEFSESAIQQIAKMFNVPAHLIAPANSNSHD